MRSMMTVLFALVLSGAALVACENKAPEAPGAATATAEKCEHGVQRSLCTRCNPKLEAVFKAKGDWCDEHKRPESQCAVCKPELAKAGVKP